MSAIPSPIALNGNLHLVSHGKSGGLGCFVADAPLELPRGAGVIVETVRGLEVGTVVGPGSDRKARLLGPALAGRLLRPLDAADAERWQLQQQLGRRIFERAQSLADQLPFEILDIDILFDGSEAILQFLGEESASFDPLIDSLAKQFDVVLRLENLSLPHQDDHDDGGCGKPDCGKGAGGSCSTCNSGGGCSSCAKGSDVDITAYFAHLRGKMEAASGRVPLV